MIVGANNAAFLDATLDKHCDRRSHGVLLVHIRLGNSHELRY